MNSKQRLDIFTGALQRGRLAPDPSAPCRMRIPGAHRTAPFPGTQVYADVTQAHPEISRANDHNTLNTLQQLGAIVELSFGAEHTHYDTNPEPHIN